MFDWKIFLENVEEKNSDIEVRWCEGDLLLFLKWFIVWDIFKNIIYNKLIESFFRVFFCL